MAEHALGCSLFSSTTINLGPRQGRSVIDNRIRSEECAFRARDRDTKRVRLRAKFRDEADNDATRRICKSRGDVFSSLMPTSLMDQISIPRRAYPTVPNYPYVGKPTDVIAYIPFSRSVCQFSKCKFKQLISRTILFKTQDKMHSCRMSKNR